MKAQHKFHTDFAMLCDDIRQENNGKQIFIGAYLGAMDIYTNPFSANFLLALFLSDLETSTGKFKFSIIIDDEEYSTNHADLGEVPRNKLFLPLPVVLREITKGEKLEVTLAFGDDEPVHIFDMNLKFLTPPA